MVQEIPVEVGHLVFYCYLKSCLRHRFRFLSVPINVSINEGDSTPTSPWIRYHRFTERARSMSDGVVLT